LKIFFQKFFKKSKKNSETLKEFHIPFLGIHYLFKFLKIHFRQKAFVLAKNFGISIKEGVYLMNAGPHYETTAEVSLAAKLGADAVGIFQ